MVGCAVAYAWVSPGGGWLAGNMAVIMETDPQFHPHRREPVEGFVLKPDCDCPQDLYALRFDLPAGTGPGAYPVTMYQTSSTRLTL